MFQRKKMFVSWAIQGRTLGQIALYWLLYNLLLWHVAFLVETLPGEGVGQPLLERYLTFCSQHLVWLTCMLAVAPLLLWDMVKLTHRVAGPLVRLERVVRQMARGERVNKITLRPHDLLGEFVAALNELIDCHNQRLEAAGKPGSQHRAQTADEREPVSAA